MEIYEIFINRTEFYKKIHYKRAGYFLNLIIWPSSDLDKSCGSYLFTTHLYCSHYSRDTYFSMAIRKKSLFLSTPQTLPTEQLIYLNNDIYRKELKNDILDAETSFKTLKSRVRVLKFKEHFYCIHKLICTPFLSLYPYRTSVTLICKKYKKCLAKVEGTCPGRQFTVIQLCYQFQLDLT